MLLEVAKHCVGDGIARPERVSGLEVEHAIDGGNVVLILAAALEKEAGLDVDDAVEINELSGRTVQAVKPLILGVGMSLVIS